MNPILQILKELNISDEKINELFQALTENPMMAMAFISQLNIPADKLQEIMSIVMADPGLIEEAVNELGLDYSKVEEAKAKLTTGNA
ncbi:DUF2999 family protein [Colwellia sp. E2M01]|uniref:DUF2999 family protein n=1 Tax=Colwellia sp. E2M01 TaxID=2841561 RepID=UPI001C0864B0|nr:DUF2999 family protein [Colwellia sp. E2M01]MBU2871555.1 DUF2999 domain-containing protein [Colwellia sp. E2M01]